MNVKKAFLFSAALLGCPLFAGPAPQQAQQALSNVDRRFFIENKGQWPEEVLYLTRMGGLDVWITRDGAVYDFYRIEETSDRSETGAADAPIDDMARFSDARRYGHVVRLRLKGARTEDITAAGQDPQPGYYNYFIGNDPSKWASFVGLYRAAVVRDVYAGIDVRYYYDGTGVRYDFIVRPGADVAAIRLALEGAEGVRITDRGELAFTTRFGEVRHAGLRAYQTADDGREVDVACRFTSAGDGTYGFEATAYDPARPLIIDPLIYSTFIGGSGNDRVNAIAVDGSGHAYVTGYTYSSNFPTTSGAYDQTHNGGSDVFVVKLNSNGSSLIYSTFIGGSSYDYGYGLAVDGSGHAYVTGYTYSSNFPTTSGAYDQTHNGSDDVFVVKLNSSGSGLIYSTFIGGSANDYGRAIAVDGSGYAYVTGRVYSSNFPTTSGAYDQTHNGSWDVFVVKLNSSGSGLIYSTFIGGSDDDWGYGLAVDGSGYAYVTGYTNSSNFPTTSGAYDQTHNGGSDVFVVKLNSSGSGLVYSTFIGGGSYDYGYGLAVDGSGHAYVTGFANSSNFPTTSGAYDQTHNGGSDVFVVKLNSSGSGLVYSTFLGGGGSDAGYGLAVDGSGHAYVTGYTNSSNFPTTSGAYDITYNGGGDVFVVKLNSSGSGLMYATFLGGSNDDRGYGLAVDGSGHAYVAGGVYSTNFPTTSGAYDQTYNGGLYDAFVTKLDLGPLPVEVADFTARVAGHAVVLEWLTASEANSRYFEVQRSPDGRRWTAIGQVPAAGESRQLRRYRMEDNRPLRGTNYYRLKAVDYDGTFDYSGVRKVVFVSEVAGPVILSENPTDGVLRVDASALAGQPLDVRILDAAGREVYRHRYTDSRRVRLAIDGPAGVYTVRLQWRDGQRTYRLMKK